MKPLQTAVMFVVFNAASCGDLRQERVAGVAPPPPSAAQVSACPPAPTEEPVEVFFSPKGGCTEAVVAMIGRAGKTIRLQAYSFTSPPIVEAIVRAKKERNVDVQAILDRSDFETDEQKELTGAGIPVFIDKKHPIAHNKVLLIDSREVEAGSFNYTRQAENNAENCNFVRYPKVVKRYEANWEAHKAHSIPVEQYVKPASGSRPRGR